ncbi:MAG: Fic family protein [Rhodoferax sp.]|nr:Fic family protein [Rhodoferax sp.]
MSATQPPNLRRITDMLPEVLFTPADDNAEAQRLVRLRKAGQIKPLYRGVYTSNFEADAADVVRRNWQPILAYLAPGAVLTHRSAFDTRPADGWLYFSRALGQRDLVLPGLNVRGIVKANRGALIGTDRPGASDTSYRGIFVASQPRAFLENLTQDKRLNARQLPRTELEARLEQIVAVRGAQAINGLRDDAREVAERLGLAVEFKALDGIVGALLGTHTAKVLTSRQAQSRAQGMPYDPNRLELFEKLIQQLVAHQFAELPEPARRGSPRAMFAFVESYFSNYIEGTTFTVEEAQDIIFNGKIILLRTEDSHDVKGTFDAVLRDPYYSKPPRTVEEFLEWIKRVNATVMQARPDKLPGQWKAQANQAGSTLFVGPDQVPETLRKAWDLMAQLTQPMQRALYAMFIVSEIHPFQDGNGRTARLLMNAFLSELAQCRIMIPTVFREDYLLSLKALSNNADATPYIRAMSIGQAWASELDYGVTVPDMNAQLDACMAKKEDSRLYRLMSPKSKQPMSI